MLRQTERATAARYGIDPAEFDARLAQARREQAAAFAAAGRAIAAWIKGKFAGLAEGYRRRAAYDELYSLDDRMLRDLGLSRGELWAAVDGQVRGVAGNDNDQAAAANDDAPRAAPAKLPFKAGA